MRRNTSAAAMAITICSVTTATGPEPAEMAAATTAS